MKQPKKLTYKQKKILVQYRLKPDNWMCVSEDMQTLSIINKTSGKIKKLLK